MNGRGQVKLTARGCDGAGSPHLTGSSQTLALLPSRLLQELHITAQTRVRRQPRKQLRSNHRDALAAKALAGRAREYVVGAVLTHLEAHVIP